MENVLSYDEWISTGRLSPYVTTRKSAGAGIKLFETAQPAGDMSDPATSSLVLIQIQSDRLRQRSDLGGGLRDSCTRAGDLALVPPYFATDIEVYGPHCIRLFTFESAHFRSAMEEARPGRDPFDFGRLHEVPFAVPQLGGVLNRMWADAADQGGGRLFAEGAALQVLGMLSRQVERGSVPAKGGLAPWAERRVRDYLHAYFARDTSLAELAALVGLSPYHFNRMFKQTTGVPPHAYLRRLRVERARQLLAETALPVTEIALAVGYDTPQAFARMFRAEAGTSPSQWRRVHGG